MTNKEKYREFCKYEKGIPIFSKDWWLDAVCVDGKWDVALVEKGGEIVASMPYFIKDDAFFKIISLPILTQRLGPYIKYPKNQKYHKRLSWEKEIMDSLIEQIPKFDTFNQTFDYSITNWLPFYWKGFNASIRYTYVIEDCSNLDLVWSNFSAENRAKIKKAKKIVNIEESNDINKFYKMVQLTFNRQNLDVVFDISLLKRLDRIENKKILFAIDKDKNIHVGIYIIWDDRSIYLLSSGGDPKLRNSGAKNLLVWEAINLAKNMGLSFDFEGSMMQNIERYNRSFGAIQKPYFQIYKTTSKLWKIKSAIDRVIKK